MQTAMKQGTEPTNREREREMQTAMKQGTKPTNTERERERCKQQ